MDAIKLLKTDHQKVSKLLMRLDNTTERGVKTRKKLFKELKQALQLHEKMEETYFYPIIKDYALTEDLTYEAYEEHHLVDDLIKKISKDDYDSKEWTAKFKLLKELIEHHVKEEETELFPKVRKVLDKSVLDEMGDAMSMLQSKAA